MWSLLSEAVDLVITVRGCWYGHYCQRLLMWSLLSEVLVGSVLSVGVVKTMRLLIWSCIRGFDIWS